MVLHQKDVRCCCSSANFFRLGACGSTYQAGQSVQAHFNSLLFQVYVTVFIGQIWASLIVTGPDRKPYAASRHSTILIPCVSAVIFFSSRQGLAVPWTNSPSALRHWDAPVRTAAPVAPRRLLHAAGSCVIQQSSSSSIKHSAMFVPRESSVTCPAQQARMSSVV